MFNTALDLITVTS